jgi:hypothetical protein
MSEALGQIYIPPYSGVRLIECRDHFQLVPVPAVQVVYGYGKIKSCEATINPDDKTSEPVWDNLSPDQEVWAVMQWFRFEDGIQVRGNICFLRPECTEEQVRKRMTDMEEMNNITREKALAMLHCYDAPQEDHDFVEDNFPNYQTEPDPKATDEYDVYHARLKVMSELQPKTVELLKIAHCTKDPEKRKIAEREAVQSFVAELVHYYTKDEIDAWQRTNPLGIYWMRELASVFDQPRRQIDPINHELAFNWLREKYNQQTAAQLAESILEKVFRWLAPGFKMTADFIKKRRERLGLTTKRKPGSPEK